MLGARDGGEQAYMDVLAAVFGSQSSLTTANSDNMRIA
jgi:hypothetical protein